MSYKKAIKHTNNPDLNKDKQQYMGFNTGCTHPKPNQLYCDALEIMRWFKDRHLNYSKHYRECIREAISSYLVNLLEYKNGMNKEENRG